MDRKTAIEWIEQIKHRISGGDEDFDRQRKEALDMAIVDMKICDANNAGWISVKDRLPEEYGNYIAVVDGKATECTYSGPLIKGIITGWSTCESDGMKWLRDEQVTHWMPLPEPLKEGT